MFNCSVSQVPIREFKPRRMGPSTADGKPSAFRFILIASILWCGSFGELHPSSSDIEYEVHEPREEVEVLAIDPASWTDETEVPPEVNTVASSVIDVHRTTSLPGPDEEDDNDDKVFEYLSHYNSTTEVDLIFVLDRSGSVPRKKWDAIIEFVKNILKHFTVDGDNTRVAVVTYSTTVSVDFDDLEPKTISDEETMCTVSTRLNSILTRKLPHGYTATYDALVSVYKSLENSRPTSKKAVLVVTDGKSNIGPPPLKAAVDILSLRWPQQSWDVQMRGPQVEIFVFGIEEMNMAELKTIASSLPNHIFTMSAFRQFAWFAKRLHGGKQQEFWAQTKLSSCGGSCNGLRMTCVCATHIGHYACTCEEGYEMMHTYCRPCKEGEYKDIRSPDRCKKCPENMTTLKEGSKSISDCVLKPGFVTCPSLPDVEHASKFFVYGTVTDEVADKGIPCSHITDGNSCHYECEEGFRLTGSPVMICNYSGNWDGTIPSCKIINCHRIEHVYEQWAGMSVNYVNHTTTYNSMVEVTCKPGTVPSTQNTRWTCDSQGQWSSSSNFYCRELFCEPLVIPDEIIIRPDVCQAARVPVDTRCHLQCADGYAQSGSSDFHCIRGNGGPLWSPDAVPACRDVHSPKIVCPNNVSLMVADWGAKSTIFHFDTHEPYVTDNSGSVAYVVRGVPEGKNFPIGTTELIYEAVDAAGNRASCVRYIQIKDRSISVRSCPTNITTTVSTLHRMADVSWPDPVFLGPGDSVMPFTCTTENHQKLPFGLHSVTCFPDGHTRPICRFMINVTDAPCIIPFEDRAPANGALVCASSSQHYTKVCRIHCREGYELRNHSSDHMFVCRWDGTWNLEGDKWPECMRVRRPSKALMDNQLYIRFSGACHEAQTKLSEEFLHTITRVLEGEHGPCPPQQTCKIEDIQMRCGSMSKRDTHLLDEGGLKRESWFHARERHRRATSRRRTIGQAANVSSATIRFQLSAQNVQSDEVFITRAGQKHLLDTLDDIFYNISDLIDDGQLKLKLGVTVVDVSSLREIKRHFKSLRCSRTEIEAKDDLSTVCYTCPPGSLLVSGSCQPCPLGTYQPDDAGSHCLPCLAGTNTKSVGARVHGDCKEPCRPGYFSESGLEKCEPCAKGSFQDSNGAKSCKKCPNGRQTLSVGSTDEEDCVELVDCQSENLRCKDGICYKKDGQEKVQCFCPVGMQSCQEPDLTPCLNNGSYTNLGDNIFGCQCSSKFTGKFCELRLTICESSSCLNGGSCVDHGSNFLCQCPAGFSGDLCESTVPKDDRTGIASHCTAVDSNGNCIHESTVASPDFDIIFSTLSSPVEKHIRWSLESSLRSLTVAMWLRSSSSSSSSSNSTRSSTILSFQTPNGLVLAIDLSYRQTSATKLELNKTGSKVSVVISLPKDSWHQIIVDWTALTGFWRVFVNESYVDEVHVSSSSDFVTAGSSLTLAEAFDGELSQFAFYDHLVPKDRWRDPAESHSVGQCRSLRGNLLQWTDLLHQVPNNSVSMIARHGSWCLDVNECQYPSAHKCRLDEVCVDKRGAWTCQPCAQLSSDGAYGSSSSSPLVNCFTHKCHHNGTCGSNGLCVCPPGFSGTFCEKYSEVSESCFPNPCLNGGECMQKDSKIICRCRENWTGRFCQVSYMPSCQLNPCVNNGSCAVVVQSDWMHYKCLCPDLGRPLGTNCEFLAICDTLPCLNGGTCVNLENQSSYECTCHANYMGMNCETPVAIAPMVPQRQYHIPSTSFASDFCRTVECHNGGSCTSTADGFLCKCSRDYKGQYCDEKRSTETKEFQVTISLLLVYDSRLHYDTTFKESFRLQIHHLFTNQTADSKMYVVINDIRRGNLNRGNVLMDFKMIFTFYLDSVVLGTEAVRQILVDHLLQGKLGSIVASFDDFDFTVIPSSANTLNVSKQSTAVYTSIIVLLLAVTLGFFFLVWQQRNVLFRNRGIAEPLNQIVNNLQQLSKSGNSIPINKASGNISEITSAKSIESDNKRIKDLLAC